MEAQAYKTQINLIGIEEKSIHPTVNASVIYYKREKSNLRSFQKSR